MLEPWISCAIGVAEMILALWMMHRGLPILRSLGIGNSLKFWAFALAIGLFGASRVEFALTGVPTPDVAYLAHTALIASAFLWMRAIMAQGRVDWWHEADDAPRAELVKDQRKRSER
jgi:hypothetical protein